AISLRGQLFGAGLDPLEVANEQRPPLLPRLPIGHAQERARMNGDPTLASVLEAERRTAKLADRHRLADQRPRSRGSERNRDRRADQFALVLDPPAAGGDLARVGLVVDPALALLDEFEML